MENLTEQILTDVQKETFDRLNALAPLGSFILAKRKGEKKFFSQVVAHVADKIGNGWARTRRGFSLHLIKAV